MYHIPNILYQSYVKNVVYQLESAYFILRIECDEVLEEDGSDTNIEDLPVQGPLPQDPDDAPFRRQETRGIRRL